MSEPKTLSLKHLRELAKKHLGAGHSKLRTKEDLVLALKKVAPALFKEERTQSPAKIIKFQSERPPKSAQAKAATSGTEPRSEAKPLERLAEPVVEGFFVARIAGESEAARHRMTEDRARPLRQVKAANLYPEAL